MRQGRICGACRIPAAVQAGEEREVLARRQFGIQKEVVPEDADGCPEGRSAAIGFVRPVQHAAAAGPQQRRQDGHHRGLARAVGAEEADDAADRGLEADARQRAPAAEMARDVLNRDLVEIERGFHS